MNPDPTLFSKPSLISLTIQAIRYGEWSWGWQTRKTWPTKHYLWWGCPYYDGYHWGLHIGPFYLNAEF